MITNLKSLKLLALSCLMACMLFSLCACGGSSSDDSGSGAEGEKAPAQAEKPKSDYDVSIVSSELTSDYSGSPALMVTYSFTNNSDKAKSFSVALSDKCFQNGVQLDSAIIKEVDTTSFNEIKPGVTTEVVHAYVLADQSVVTVEVEELFSLSDELLLNEEISVA